MKALKFVLCMLPGLLGWGPVVQAAADVQAGENIYKHCKLCHGKEAEGGKGKYPRIAGLPQDYIERQLSAFKHKKRINKPMIPIFGNFRFNQDAIASVAAYLAQLPVPDVRAQRYEPSAEALELFDSREEFKLVGEELFQGNCAECHGETARGRKDKESPPLVNQHPRYLLKQIRDFAGGVREHKHARKMFGEMDPEEHEAIVTYLSRMDWQ